jgi:hypothetical protein
VGGLIEALDTFVRAHNMCVCVCTYICIYICLHNFIVVCIDNILLVEIWEKAMTLNNNYYYYYFHFFFLVKWSNDIDIAKHFQT